MDISFKNRRLEKSFQSMDALTRRYGPEMAKKIKARMYLLEAADTLGEFFPPYSGQCRCHELKGSRKGEFSIDLKHPYRLIFAPAGLAAVLNTTNEWEWAAITAIKILTVEDTHD